MIKISKCILCLSFFAISYTYSEEKIDCSEFKSAKGCLEIHKYLYESINEASLPTEIPTSDKLEDEKIKNTVGLCEIDPTNEICKKTKK